MRRSSLLLALLGATLASACFGQSAPPVLKLEDGGTGANNASAARANLGAAATGANHDITSLSGLTTVLPPAEGGTGSSGGVSPSGSLSTTPETVVNVADFGGCTGNTTNDTASLNAALAAARSSSAYTSDRPVRVTGGLSTTGVACAVTQINATGFTRFGAGGRLIIDDLTLTCSGSGNICLDTLGSLNVQFNRVTIIGSSASAPMIGLQEGNVAPLTIACCIHTHFALEITGSFTFAGLYSAASESTTYHSPIIRNNGASRGVIGALGAVVPGSGYVNGVYSGVALTGSSTGVGAVATITVSGGAVTSVVLTNQGKQFAVGDALTASASVLGGTGSGFHASVASIGQFAMVLDGQNHWGLSSPFQSITWPADTYYTFTENNIIGGSLRYYGSGAQGAPLWVASLPGLRLVHIYAAQGAQGPCVYLFDNNATYSVHNINEVLEVQCESGNATYDVQLTGSNPNPVVDGLEIIDPQTTVNTAVLGVDPGIASVTAHNSVAKIGYSTSSVPLFAIGAASLWNFDGEVRMPATFEYNAPGGSRVQGGAQGVSWSAEGPLDVLNSYNGVAAAYSCARKLTYTYAGPLCNIRRASDSVAIDFYPNPAGVIEKSALSAFCAGTSCFIALEYDQSGNGQPARNVTASTQPAVVIEGAGLNYAVCGVWGNASNVSLTVNASTTINNLFGVGGFVSVVTNNTATPTSADRLLSRVSGSTGWEISGAITAGFRFPQFTLDASVTNGAWVSATPFPSSGGLIFDIVFNYSIPSSSPAFAINGLTSANQSSVSPVGAISDTNNVVIGNSAAGGLGWAGDICEVVVARQSLSAVQLEAIRRNQAVFYGLAGVL
jgi:hypothetical protein